jgi:hypothetical protein
MNDVDILKPENNVMVRIVGMLHGLSPRECITKIEAINGESEQVDCPHTRRMIANGIYYGEQVIPEGTVITGAVHLYEHFFMILQGEMTLFTEDGLSFHKAPEIFIARAGSKRIGYAHSDCVVANIERVEDGIPCDTGALWKHLYVGTFDEYDTYLESVRDTQCH